MLSYTEIQKEYDSRLSKFSRGLLREYLQYVILSIVFDHPNSHKLSFLGGTALRIVYNVKRFSEDIDFDNKGLTYTEFEEIGQYLKIELERLGYIVEIKVIKKGAFHCYIKFPQVLYEQGISPLPDEKILIQLDTFDQGVDYTSNTFILDKFDLFKQIIVTPKEVILSQKIWTITQRKRFKGRDFYDIMHLLQNTKPDKKFLEAKFGTLDLGAIKNTVLKSLSNANWDEISKDVAPFLLDPNDSKKIILFEDFFKQKFQL